MTPSDDELKDYKVIGHDKNNPCSKCGLNLFCKDCGVCVGCGYSTEEDEPHD